MSHKADVPKNAVRERSTMLISSVTPTELFLSSPAGPAQVLEGTGQGPEPGATVRGPGAPVTGRVADAMVGQAPAAEGRIEVPLTGLVGAKPGDVVDARVSVGS